MRRVCTVFVVAACGAACGTRDPRAQGPDDAAGGADAAGEVVDAAPHDGALADASTATDASSGADAFVADALVPIDAAPLGPITGGPCLSGAAGQTAYRIRWAGNGPGSTAYVVYEVNGLPDRSRDHAGAFGYQIGYTPRFDDVFLGDGGLVLDGSNFVDLELSTVGVASIQSATLSIFGRSFNTTASGSFHWQSFDGVGAAPTNLVSNVAPYEWYGADMTTEISPGDDGVLLRIKAGPSSNVLVVNRIEICVQAS